VTVAVVVFPGSNCEHDVVRALRGLGADADLVFHKETDLDGAAGVILPGGFAHGDYLRTGAIARFSPIMTAVEEAATAGTPVLGICNGFQVLTEAGLLPGALVANRDLRYICRFVSVRVESTDSILTRNAEVGRILRIPLNSYQGNYVDGGTAPNVVLRYVDDRGVPTAAVNGSTVAGVANTAGSVVGLMPHPERASEDLLGSADGVVLLESFVSSLSPVAV
jgi:phosphoribosylformylglycinamidine synthase subunit PurQ / glutaminase